MPKIIRIPESETLFQLQFMCPACKITHAISWQKNNSDTWEFDENYDSPTITPSVLCRGYRFDENRNSVPYRCHSWITNGKIKFFSDCSHGFVVEQWVELPEITIGE